MGDQCRVFDRASPVGDALRGQRVQRAPYAARPDMLPGMRCTVQASSTSAIEQRRKWLGRMAGLRAAQAECDHALRARLNRHVDRVRRPTPRLGLATLPRPTEVEDPSQLDVEFSLGPLTGAAQALE